MDSAVFFFPSDDNVIHFRSERPEEMVWDQNINKKRLIEMRTSLRNQYPDKYPDRVREQTFADYERVGRNSAGQIVAEREALQ